MTELVARTRSRPVDDRAWDSKSRTAGGSLFDRLLIDEEDLGVPSGNYNRPELHLDSVVRSVKRNLERALNVHAGGAAANPKYGIEEFTGSTASSNDATANIVGSIGDCIRMAEPRIEHVEVERVADPDQPLMLRFVVRCSIRVASVDQQVRIDMAMRDGHFYQIG